MGSYLSSVKAKVTATFSTEHETTESDGTSESRWRRIYGVFFRLSYGSRNPPLDTQEASALPETIAEESSANTEDRNETAKCCADNRSNSLPQSSSTSLDGSSSSFQAMSTNRSRQEGSSYTSGSPSEETTVYDACNDDLEEMIRDDENNGKIPVVNGNGRNVLILHADEDVEAAVNLARVLRERYRCRIPSSVRDVFFRIYGGEGLAGAQNWADAILIIVSDAWVNTIRSIRRGQRSNLERYNYMVIQSQWISDDGVNRKIVPVVLPQTDPSGYRDIPEIRGPITFDDCIERFEDIVIRFIEAGRRRVANNHQQQPRNPENNEEDPVRNK